jgi:hypothetical protein
MFILENFNASRSQKVSFVVITASYLRFSYAFRPMRESATFLLATMDLGRKTHPDAMKMDIYGPQTNDFVM